MTSVIIFGIVAIALLFALYWLSLRARVDRDSKHLLEALPVEDLLPHHYRYFSQVRQALSKDDESYMVQQVGPDKCRKALRVRREVAMEFLRGLREDYHRFDRLARALTALAPAANPQREMERFRLSIRFTLNWRIVWLRLWLGATSLNQLQNLANQVGSLSTRLEDSIRAWQESLAAPQIMGLRV